MLKTDAVPATADPRPTRRRADVLADRIEEGAARLASYVEGLSETEWHQPVSATDRRPVGVVVHHVAYIYPIEIEAARAIARGQAVETAWPAIAGLNAKHAAANANVTKAEALEILARNSREAAAAVRAFQDEDLDRAASFGLSDGATVTAQYVIEDHAMRHAWHHLAKIREAVGRA
jgi:hypothetical protein